MSADSIQSYDKEFWMSTMQYQIAWKEVKKRGGSGATLDERVRGPADSPVDLMTKGL